MFCLYTRKSSKVFRACRVLSFPSHPRLDHVRAIFTAAEQHGYSFLADLHAVARLPLGTLGLPRLYPEEKSKFVGFVNVAWGVAVHNARKQCCPVLDIRRIHTGCFIIHLVVGDAMANLKPAHLVVRRFEILDARDVRIVHGPFPQNTAFEVYPRCPCLLKRRIL